MPSPNSSRPALASRGRRRFVEMPDPNYAAGMAVGLARVQRVFSSPVIEGRERDAAMLLGKGFSADAIIAGLSS